MPSLQDLLDNEGEMRREGTQKSVILHDRYDSGVYKDTVSEYPPMQETITATEEKLPDVHTFAEDAFHSFYKYAPTLRDESELTRTAQVRQHMLREIMGTKEYRETYASGTASNPYASAIAANAITQEVLSKVDRPTRQQMNTTERAEQEMRQHRDAAERAEQEADEEEDPNTAQHLREVAQAYRQKAAQAEQQAETSLQQLMEHMTDIEDTTRRASRNALKRVQSEIEEVNDATNAFAGSGYGYEQGQQQQMLGVKEKIALANRIRDNRKLALIARLAGRLENTAMQKQRTKVKHPPDTIVGVELGNNLTQVLPTEMLLLADEWTELLFFQRYLEHALMQWEMIGYEPQDRGPIIACTDTSESMLDPLSNSQDMMEISKEIWSKACILALRSIAAKQNRDFAVLYFSSYGELKEYHFPKGKSSMDYLIDCAEFFFNGGTSFNDWMVKSLEIAERTTYKNADLIVITDGDALISDETRDNYNTQREERKMHAYGIMLDADPSKRALATLKSVTDAMITISDLKRDGEALDLVFSNI